jgi:hypothetical protein
MKDTCRTQAPLLNTMGHKGGTRSGPYLKRACILIKERDKRNNWKMIKTFQITKE